MAGCAELKKLSKARLRSAKLLMDGGDWDGSAYMMGHVLETALKSAACKTLHLTDYPETTGNKKVDAMFMTHKFDQLLIISGLSDLFTFGSPGHISSKYSAFVQEYPGEWINMRYDPTIFIRFDEIKVKNLYNNLYQDSNSITKTLSRRNRW